MLKSFNVDVERVYDPDYVQIQTSLKAFVENQENSEIDMCFVIFMGHGCTTRRNVHDVNLEIKDGFFDIWSESVNIFRKETSLLREKPKVFLVQACRSIDDRLDDSDMISLRTPATFTDYKFVFTSQPGMVANREYHFFIDTLTSLVTKEAHRKHLCDLINKKLCMEFKKYKNDPRVNNQMPQICESLPNLLNTFPGITKDFLSSECQNVKQSQEECEGNTDYLSQLALPILNTITNECKGQNPRTHPVSTENSNDNIKVEDPTDSRQSEERDKSIPECKNKIDKTHRKDKQDEEKKDVIEEVNNTNYHVILQVESTVQPSTETNDQKTKQALFDLLKHEKQKEEMEKYLAAECETPVLIDDITLGSILLHITCDMKALDILHFLSETGLLSSKFTTLLVTKDFLEKCHVSQVALDVKLKIQDEKTLETLTPMIYNLPFTLCFLRKTFTIKAPVQKCGEVEWFHDDIPITAGDRIEFYTAEDNTCSLKVNNACITDTGLYSGKYTSSDGFPVLVKMTVLVINQSAPSNVEAVADSSEEQTINVSWEPADGEVIGYHIDYSLGCTGAPPQTLSTSLDMTNATITDALPGETYNISVSSVSEEGLSDPEPPGGITVLTTPEIPVAELHDEPYHTGLYRINWQKPNKNNVFLVITMLNLKGTVNTANTFVLPSTEEKLNIKLMDKQVHEVNHLPLCKTALYACKILSLYKGIVSREMQIKTQIEYFYVSLPEYVIQESTKEYFVSVKQDSYPISLQTLTRGRAIVFITGGKYMQYRTDFDLIKLLASLSIQYWLIYDPDVETIDFYLKDFFQIQEHDVVDYCLVFFIRHETNSDCRKSEMEYNIFDKCTNVQHTILPHAKVPILVFVNSTLELETRATISESQMAFPLSQTPHCSDLYFCYINTSKESNKLIFLSTWVKNVLRKCHQAPLEDITELAFENFKSDSETEELMGSWIVSTLTKKLNLFPCLTQATLDKQEQVTSSLASPATSKLDISTESDSELEFLLRRGSDPLSSYYSRPDSCSILRDLTPEHFQGRSNISRSRSFTEPHYIPLELPFGRFEPLEFSSFGRQVNLISASRRQPNSRPESPWENVYEDFETPTLRRYQGRVDYPQLRPSSASHFSDFPSDFESVRLRVSRPNTSFVSDCSIDYGRQITSRPESSCGSQSSTGSLLMA